MVLGVAVAECGPHLLLGPVDDPPNLLVSQVVRGGEIADRLAAQDVLQQQIARSRFLIVLIASACPTTAKAIVRASCDGLLCAARPISSGCRG